MTIEQLDVLRRTVNAAEEILRRMADIRDDLAADTSADACLRRKYGVPPGMRLRDVLAADMRAQAALLAALPYPSNDRG